MKTKNPIKHRSPNASSLRDPKHRQRVKPDKREQLERIKFQDGKLYFMTDNGTVFEAETPSP